MSHRSALSPLVSSILLILGPHWDSSVVVLCRGDAFGMQEQPLHMIQQIIDGVNVGLGQFIALILGLGAC